MSQNAYKADVTPNEAWETLIGEDAGVMVDVRTRAEWTFVGLPDLSSAGQTIIAVEWQTFPTMAHNAEFVSEVESKIDDERASKDRPIFFLCRSGARSALAAAAMTEAGYTNCFNVAGGFEGHLNEVGHRGQVDGWKADGLPWRQA